MRLLFLWSFVVTSVYGDVGFVQRWILESQYSPSFVELAPHERTSPVLMGDILFVANRRGQVVALHRTLNYELWRVQMPGPVDGALTYARSKLFVGDTQGNLWALNARDGSKAWEFKIQAALLSPPVVSRDRVFFSTSNDELFSLSEVHGREIWHYSHRGEEKMTVRGVASPALFMEDVIQGFSDGTLVKLTVRDGKIVWSKRLRSRDRFYDVDTRAHVDDSYVIAGTFDGRIYSLDRNTGHTHWIFNAGSYGSFLVEEDRVYFSGLDGYFYALQKSNGSEVWKSPFDQGVGMTPVKVGERLIIPTSSDPLYVLDVRSGKPLFKVNLGSGSFSPVVSSPDGWIYSLSNYGNLYAFELISFLNSNRDFQIFQTPMAYLRVPSG